MREPITHDLPRVHPVLIQSPLAPAPTHQGLADFDPWEAEWQQRAWGATPAAAARTRSVIPYQWLAEALEVVALALFMFIAVRGVAQNFIVDGGSMEPNFHNGELVIVNKIAFREITVPLLPFVDQAWRPFGLPEPGDVVVFEFPQDPKRDFIKRVIAVPGQSVEVREGKVFVDGVIQDEPYLSEPPHYTYGPVTVPDGHLFVLGDNRNNSYDSHSWGMLPEKHLIGRAEFRYWPLEAAGRISSHPLEASTRDGGASSQ
jgi:signal peptidase I